MRKNIVTVHVLFEGDVYSWSYSGPMPSVVRDISRDSEGRTITVRQFSRVGERVLTTPQDRSALEGIGYVLGNPVEMGVRS